MNTIEFDEVNVRIAEHQEEYETLPVFYNKEEGSITCCFELSQEEKDQVLKTGKIWFKQLTFGNPMQPIAMSVIKDELIKT